MWRCSAGAKANFDARVVGLLPQSLIMLHKVVPVAFVNNAVTLAMVNPSNLVAFDDVRRYIKGVIIEPQVCTEEDFRKFMDTIYADLMGIKEEKREAEHKKADERERRKEEKKKQKHFLPKQSKTFCRKIGS